MISISIIVPTLKTMDQLTELKKELDETVDFNECEVIYTCQNASASVNRNYGLNNAKGEYIIQIDDDILNFPKNWYNLLVDPLKNDLSIIQTSARLMRKDGVTENFMVGLNYGTHFKISEYLTEVPAKRLPSACIAMRKNSIKYREEFIGSGCEDSAYCYELTQMFPNGRFIVVENCKVVHLNEQKNQCGNFNTYNRDIFYKIYGFHV